MADQKNNRSGSASSSTTHARARRTPAKRATNKPTYNGTGVNTGDRMRRPRGRRAPAQVTAEFGHVEPRQVKRKKSKFLYGIIGGKKIETVKVKSGNFPWQAMIVAAACTVIVMALVLNYVRINELTNKYSDMQDEMLVLISQRKTLNLTLERKNDLLDFEKQAEELGMVKSDKVEKRYINIQNEDKVEVPGGEKTGIADFFENIFGKISEYFRNIF